MTRTPVVGQSPLSMSIKGQYVMLPLSALFFEDNGEINATLWPSYADPDTKSAVDAYLGRLILRGTLRPGAKPTAKPAFLAKAVSGGAAAQIAIDIANVTPDAADPSESAADFTVTETNTYIGLLPAKLMETIGTAAGGGTRPGLVFVTSAQVDLPKGGVYPMGVANAGDAAGVDVPAALGAGSAFTLQTRAKGADAVLTAIEIKDVDTAAGTFTLVANWTKTAAALKMKVLADTFAYSMAITAPPDGFLAPAAGKTTLGGGSDPISAIAPTQASVIVLAQ